MFRLPRKLYDNLSERDLIRSPVWAYCHEVDYERWWYEWVGEEWIRPLQKNESIQRGAYIERVTLVDKLSRAHVGMVTRSNWDERSSPPELIRDLGPMLVSGKRKVNFWRGLAHLIGLDFIRRDAAVLREILGPQSGDLFPLQVRIPKGRFGEALSFVIDGFYGFINDQHEIARLDV